MFVWLNLIFKKIQKMTKKIVTTFLIISFFIIAKGQITKKSILLGGQIAYASYKESTSFSGDNVSKGKQGIFNVSIGKAFKENVIYGFNVSYNPYDYKNNFSIYRNEYNLKMTGYTFGLFRRDYEKLAKDFYFFTEAGLRYTNERRNYSDSLDNIYKTEYTSQGKLYVTPGLSYRIYKNFSWKLLFQIFYL
jgi:hypothetical protein